MRKVCEILKKKDIGAIGIGAMIVFIAMVLVAGIAASVLVQTANKLEIQAMQTGDQTRDEVATGIYVVDIEAQKGNRNISGTWYNDTLHNLTITVAPRAGSNDIDLSTTVIELTNSTVKCILTWDTTYASAVSGSGVFATNAFDLGPDDFGIIVLEDADGSCGSSTPVINRGDKVMLTVNLTACFHGLSERTDVWGTIIPEEGAPGAFAFRTPPSIAADTVFDLY